MSVEPVKMKLLKAIQGGFVNPEDPHNKRILEMKIKSGAISQEELENARLRPLPKEKQLSEEISSYVRQRQKHTPQDAIVAISKKNPEDSEIRIIEKLYGLSGLTKESVKKILPYPRNYIYKQGDDYSEKRFTIVIWGEPRSFVDE